MAGFLINSRGTTIMVDPLLEGFDMPLLITFPIASRAVPKLDAVLLTHSDNDHYSVPTNKALNPVTRVFHSTRYVDTLMKRDSLPSVGHDFGDRFDVGAVRVTVTPADHDWPNAFPRPGARHFRKEDSAGFWIETPVGFANAVRMADAYPDTPLLLYHGGSVNAPTFTPFNADPQSLYGVVKNPGRIHVLAPGEPFTLKRVRKS